MGNDDDFFSALHGRLLSVVGASRIRLRWEPGGLRAAKLFGYLKNANRQCQGFAAADTRALDDFSSESATGSKSRVAGSSSACASRSIIGAEGNFVPFSISAI